MVNYWVAYLLNHKYFQVDPVFIIESYLSVH